MHGRVELDLIGWRLTLAVGPKGILLDTTLLSEVEKPGIEDAKRPTMEATSGGQFEHGFGFSTPAWSPHPAHTEPDP